jgi:hypothetical protein
MTRLEDAAVRVHEVLWNNIGNADWPISFRCDAEIYDVLADALNELSAAVEEVKPGSCPWPVQSFINSL